MVGRIQRIAAHWQRQADSVGKCELRHYFLIALVIATGLTWWIGLANTQYQNVSELAFVDGFPGDPANWISSTSGDVTFNQRSIEIGPYLNGPSHTWQIVALPSSLKTDLVRTKALFTVVEPDQSRPANRRASYMLSFADTNGNILRYQTIQLAQRSRGTIDIDRVVKMPDGTSQLYVAIIGKESIGSVRLADVQLHMVRLHPVYPVLATGLILFWSVILLWAGYHLARSLGVFTSVGLATLCALMALGITMSTSWSEAWIRPLVVAVAGLFVDSPNPKAPLVGLYKFGHVGIFFFFTLLLLHVRRRLAVSSGYVLLVTLMLAIATEGVQLHFYERSSQLIDLAFDCAGIVLAAVIYFLLAALVNLANNPYPSADDRQ